MGDFPAGSGRGGAWEPIDSFPVIEFIAKGIAVGHAFFVEGNPFNDSMLNATEEAEIGELVKIAFLIAMSEGLSKEGPDIGTDLFVDPDKESDALFVFLAVDYLKLNRLSVDEIQGGSPGGKEFGLREFPKFKLGEILIQGERSYNCPVLIDPEGLTGVEDRQSELATAATKDSLECEGTLFRGGEAKRVLKGAETFGLIGDDRSGLDAGIDEIESEYFRTEGVGLFGASNFFESIFDGGEGIALGDLDLIIGEGRSDLKVRLWSGNDQSITGSSIAGGCLTITDQRSEGVLDDGASGGTEECQQAKEKPESGRCKKKRIHKPGGSRVRGSRR